MKTLLC